MVFVSCCCGHCLLLTCAVLCFAVRCCAVPRCAVQEAGYDESTQLMVEDVMMSKNVPDPRDIRKYDLIGVFGMINYRTLKVRALGP